MTLKLCECVCHLRSSYNRIKGIYKTTLAFAEKMENSDYYGDGLKPSYVVQKGTTAFNSCYLEIDN